MPEYRPPLRDMRFVYSELFNEQDLRDIPDFEEVTPDLVDAMLEEAGKFCQQRLQPLNQVGDQQGCRCEDGVVSTPEGFPQAYREFSELGLGSLTAPVEYGGQGMPKTLGLLIEELVCSSNLAFSLYPGLTMGACNAILAKGSEEIKQTWLPKIIEGEWTAAMALTEPHSGTDLGLLRTRAEPNDDGSYSVTGTKIFITAGEHDMADNIVHLVLAKTPDAPAGIKGISMFLVPKFLLDESGNPASANDVSCGSIEHKMGIHGASTCVMNYESSKGYLVGELHKGMAAMFIMMNAERLFVGIQGLGVAEAARQGAVAYAQERLQGRALSGAKYPEQSADPILVHPDVRKMLLTQRAYAEGGRALVTWVARELDMQAHHPDADRRAEAEQTLALLTPVVKAFLTDVGFECANLGVQVFGGHGYIQEYGMEQLVRDARIAQIYEGTNGIQAMDLAMRKLSMAGGALPSVLFTPVEKLVTASMADPKLKPMAESLGRSLLQLQESTLYLQQQIVGNPDNVGAGASDYLRLMGAVTLGYLWLRMATVALDKVDGPESVFYQAKVDTAKFYFERLLPQCEGLCRSILNGGDSLMNFNDEAFSL